MGLGRAIIGFEASFFDVGDEAHAWICRQQWRRSVLDTNVVIV